MRLVLRGFSLSAVMQVGSISERQWERPIARGDIETYTEDGVWKNKREGSSRAFEAGYATKDAALASSSAGSQEWPSSWTHSGC